MNKAMVEQRAHYALSSEAKKRSGWTSGEDDLQVPERALPDTRLSRRHRLAPVPARLHPDERQVIADPAHPRGVVDVIWFPTGGGKTEAYLGLAAFIILLRRLLNPQDAGTTVLMRYTLRLLTTQQFQRAASLICALEHETARPRRFGRLPVSIGLWLGTGVTPNSDADSVADFKPSRPATGEPVLHPLLPLVRGRHGPKTIRGGSASLAIAERTRRAHRVEFRCEDPGCDFSTEPGLPIEVVDQGIYSPRRRCSSVPSTSSRSFPGIRPPGPSSGSTTRTPSPRPN